MRKINKAEIALYVELVIAVVFTIFSIIDSIKNGRPFNGMPMSVIYLLLTSGFLALENEKKNK